MAFPYFLNINNSNFEISIGETAQLIAEIMNYRVRIISDDERVRPKNSEVERLWADNSKAKKLFNWEPKYPGLDGFKRGLLETIEWFTQPENLREYKSHTYNL